MNNSNNTALDVRPSDRKVVRKCTEPKCEAFGSGHEEFELGFSAEDIDHTAQMLEGAGYSVAVRRNEASPMWAVELDVYNGGSWWTPDEISSLSADLLTTADAARALNEK